VGNPTCADRSDTDNSQLNYIVWWVRNFPGRGNSLIYQGLPMRNGWDVHRNRDAFVSQHLRMTLPATGVRYSFEDGALHGWSATGQPRARPARRRTRPGSTRHPGQATHKS